MTRLTLKIALLALVPAVLGAQVRPAPAPVGADSMLQMLAGAPGEKTTRADLEAKLLEIQQVLGSSGYSAALKGTRQAEAAMIRRRLAEGDIFPGDVILLQVSGDPRMNNLYGVTPKRTILVPGAGELPVGGLLRSELEAHLTTEVAKFVRNPSVRAEPLLRLQVSGAVNKPGFYTVPSSMPIPDLLMQFAGGPSSNAEVSRSTVVRGGEVVLPGSAVDEAVREARSVDALNLVAGDELRVGTRPSSGTIGRVLAAVGSAASLAWILVQVF